MNESKGTDLVLPCKRCPKVNITLTDLIASDEYKDFLGILLSAGDLGSGAQKDIIMNFKE